MMRSLLLLCFRLWTLLSPVAAESTAAAIRLNLGSDFEADGSHVSFDRQAHLGIGSVFEISTLRSITNVPVGYPESLYKTLVQNDAPFTYQIPLTTKTAAVRLRFHFCEITNFKPGVRIFSVLAEGVTVIQDLDVAADAGNFLAHVVEVDQVIEVADGLVDVEFVPTVDYAMISGIEVIPVVPEPTRINLGGSNVSVGTGGETLLFTPELPLGGFLSSGVVLEEALADDQREIGLVGGSNPVDLYRSRVSGSDFSYTIPVPSVIRVDLLFHFCDDLTPGANRVFAIEVDGELVIPELDVAQEATQLLGGRRLASDLRSPESRALLEEEHVRENQFISSGKHRILSGDLIDLALHQNATASLTASSNPPSAVVDGTFNDYRGVGTMDEPWLRVTFQHECDAMVQQIVLVPSDGIFNGDPWEWILPTYGHVVTLSPSGDTVQADPVYAPTRINCGSTETVAGKYEYPWTGDDASGAAEAVTYSSNPSSGKETYVPGKIYRSCRDSSLDFSYAVPVPQTGEYSLVLHFRSRPGEFNVTVSGTQVLTNFDLERDVGVDMAYIWWDTYTLLTTANIVIEFTQLATICAVELYPLVDEYVYDLPSAVATTSLEVTIPRFSRLRWRNFHAYGTFECPPPTLAPIQPTVAPSASHPGAYIALTKRVRVFVKPDRQNVTARFFALPGSGEDAMVSGIEVVPVAGTEPLRINVGSYETLTSEDGTVFGSQSDFLFDLDNSLMPEYGFNEYVDPHNGDNHTWQFQRPNFLDLNVSLPPNATESSVKKVPELLYESIAYKNAFRCSIPLPADWSYVQLRVHLRRPDGVLSSGGSVSDPNAGIFRTYLHQLERAPFSTRLGVRQLFSAKELDRNEEPGDPDDEFVYVWSGYVEVDPSLGGAANNNNMLYLFFTSDADIFDNEYFHATVSGIEISRADDDAQPDSVKPIRLYEGSSAYSPNWRNASLYRALEPSHGIEFRTSPAQQTVHDPFYDVSLYEDCLRVDGVSKANPVRYAIPVSTEVRAYELRLHVPASGQNFEYSMLYQVNGFELEKSGSISTNVEAAQVVTNLATTMQDQSVALNPIVKTSDDGILNIALYPVPGKYPIGTNPSDPNKQLLDTVILCGLEIHPYTKSPTRVNPAAPQIDFAYGERLSFYSAELALMQDLRWYEWGVYQDPRTDKATAWEEFTALHPNGLVQYSSGDSSAGLIDEEWTSLYPEAMMTSSMSAMDFGMEFGFELPVPANADFVIIRLFFVETLPKYWGRRKFHVEIDGIRVLTDFTMHREGWANYSLLIEEFPIATGDRDSIIIKFITPQVDESLFEDVFDSSPTASPAQGQSRFDSVFSTRDSWVEVFGSEVEGPLPPPLFGFEEAYPFYEVPFGVYKPTAQINGIEILPFDPQTHINGIRINCGGRGRARDFMVDAFYSGENMNVTNDGSGGLGEMSSQREGTTIRYAIPVATDVTHVFVRLGFIELDNGAAGSTRTCSVNIEGEVVRSALNVATEAGGTHQELLIFEFVRVGPENRLVDVVLESVDGTTPCILSTLEVLPWEPFISDAMLLDAGQESAPNEGPSYPFDGAFGVLANAYFDASSGGVTVSSIFSAYQGKLAIKNVPRDVPQRVYKSMVYGQDFSYKFQTPSDHCRIILHMADICFDEENVESRVFDTTCGVRTMDVFLKEAALLEGFTAAPLTAYTKSFDVKLDEKIAELRFVSNDKTNEFKFAFVNAIEIINLHPFTLNLGSSLYSDSLASGHYLLNTQEPRQWATTRDILNVKDGYTSTMYQTLYGSKDLSFQLPSNARAMLIRFHFCDITESGIVRKQRIYIDGEIVLEDFNPVAAAQEDYGESSTAGAEPLAYFWDALHIRKRYRKVKIRIQSQLPGEQAIISAIQLIPLFDNNVANFGVSSSMQNLGTQNVVGMQGQSIRTSFFQAFDVPVTATHGFLKITLTEIHEEENRIECDELKARLNTITVAGKVVLQDLNVCQLAGGYGLPYIWTGSAPASDIIAAGVIRVTTEAGRPYEYPIVAEIEAFSHYIEASSSSDDAVNAIFAPPDDDDDAGF